MYRARVTPFRSAACIARVRAGMGRNLDRAANHLRDGVRVDIGTPGPPRSRRYNPPHVDTRHLWESYAFETDFAGLRSRVGSPDVAAYWLETGTARMRPRPHLLAALVNRLPDLARIACTPLI